MLDLTQLGLWAYLFRTYIYSGGVLYVRDNVQRVKFKKYCFAALL